jgi:hypothetical protein
MFSLFQEVLSTSVVLNDNIVCGSPAEAVQLESLDNRFTSQVDFN